MLFKQLNKKIILFIIVIAVLILYISKNSIRTKSTENFVDSVSGNWGPYQRNVHEYGGPYPSGALQTKDALIEGFVPWNSEKVGNLQVSTVRLDQAHLVSLFKSLVDEDRDKIETTYIPSFRDQPHGREQARAYINHVLARINRKSGRKFHILDIQATNKESGFDTRTNAIIDKWTSELFIQEKDSRKVHAHSMNIRMVMLTQAKIVQIKELHFITDYFYKRPLVGGGSPNKEYFRIKNPFHIQQPFFTSDDKVLPDTADSDEILVNHHKDLRQPQYRCFQESGGATPTQDKTECDVSSGYWDKPVTNDNECPFFGKNGNKNYPNRLGGISIDGKSCEMPINTKRIGYRFISNDPQHKPWCRNCHVGALGDIGGIGPCCQDQKNKELYPNLVSPDYAFPGSELEAGQSWKLLQQRGMTWRSHPTTIKNITNKNQRQPVFNAIISPGPGKL